MDKHKKDEEKTIRTLDPVAEFGRTKVSRHTAIGSRRAKAMHQTLLSGEVLHPYILRNFRNIGYKLTGKRFSEVADKCPLNLDDWGIILGIDDFPDVINDIEYFPPLYTEKIFETLLLCNLGKEVYGNEEDFEQWLNQPPIPYFGDRSPKELLSYSSGFNELHNALQIIDYGQTA